MYLGVLILHIAVCVVMTGLILLQHGKGADAGVAFGAGSTSGQSNTMGMTKCIGAMAGVFFCTSLALGVLSGHNHSVVRSDRLTPNDHTSEKTHNTDL